MPKRRKKFGRSQKRGGGNKIDLQMQFRRVKIIATTGQSTSSSVNMEIRQFDPPVGERDELSEVGVITRPQKSDNPGECVSSAHFLVSGPIQ